MSKFKAETHLVRSPTLLIGIGGIGGRIVKSVNEMMSAHDRSCVKMVVMDTDANALETFENSNISYVQTSESCTVQNYLLANESYLDWFPTDPFINAKSLIQGAGQIRSVSRLGALASKAAGRFSVIDNAIQEVLTNQGNTVRRSVRVMIVGSATGGTGSGLGVQLPFYVKEALRLASVPNVLVRGLFLMPSLTDGAIQDTESKRKAVNVNGYAFLKELNAFYHHQTTPADKNPLSIEEYVPGMKGDSKTAAVGMIPYDFLFLVEKMSKNGTLGGLDEYIARSSQIVINQLFSPVSNNGFSAEDNLITATVPSAGMNRYCGAGVSNAIYPKDEIVRYCTLRYADQMLGSFWLEIDRRFRQKDEQQRRLRKTNPNLAQLKKGDVFCQVFDEMCDPMKQKGTSELIALKAEMAVKTLDENGLELHGNLNDMLLGRVESFVNETFAAAGLLQKSEECKMTATPSSDREDIATNIVQSSAKLQSFKKEASDTVNALVVSAIESIFPSDLKTAKGTPDTADHNLYVVLKEKHPLVARYMLYTLVEQLKKKKSDVDARLNQLAYHQSFFTKDYFVEGKQNEPKESATEALGKTKAGWLAAFNLYSAAYKGLVQEIIEDISGEAKTILESSRFTFQSIAYHSVIERLEVMIDLYEKFFDEMENIVRDQEKEIDLLENGMGETKDGVLGGDKYVCSNAQCKKALYAEFEQNVTGEELEMTGKVKNEFFDKMYQEFTAEYQKLSNPTAHIIRTPYRELFETGILQPIVKQFDDNAFKHLDMSVLDAIYKQYCIETEVPMDKNSTSFHNYFGAVCNMLTSLSAPYLLYETQVAGYTSGGKLSYAFGLNHSGVADFQTGDPTAAVNATSLNGLFGNGFVPPLVDDSFSPYVLTCYSTIYDLRIENCESYKVGSTAERCYNERLQNYANREHYVFSTDPDSQLEVIQPHLDRRWHNHAFLPELMEYDDIVMCEKIRRAFLLAVVMGRCEYVIDNVEHLQCWCYKDNATNRAKPIFVNDTELKSASMFALCQAFEYHRVMVDEVLDFAKGKLQEALDSASFSGITEDGVLEQYTMKALCAYRQEQTAEGKAVSYSVLDVLYDLYKASGDRLLTEKMVNTLSDYLAEYALTMMNGNQNKAAALQKKMQKAIGDATLCLKGEVSSFFKEDVAAFIGE